jgi:coenzyme F420-reducing hydrogenase delta subunit
MDVARPVREYDEFARRAVEQEGAITARGRQQARAGGGRHQGLRHRHLGGGPTVIDADWWSWHGDAPAAGIEAPARSSRSATRATASSTRPPKLRPVRDKHAGSSSPARAQAPARHPGLGVDGLRRGDQGAGPVQPTWLEMASRRSPWLDESGSAGCFHCEGSARTARVVRKDESGTRRASWLKGSPTSTRACAKAAAPARRLRAVQKASCRASPTPDLRGDQRALAALAGDESRLNLESRLKPIEASRKGLRHDRTKQAVRTQDRRVRLQWCTYTGAGLSPAPAAAVGANVRVVRCPHRALDRSSSPRPSSAAPTASSSRAARPTATTRGQLPRAAALRDLPRVLSFLGVRHDRITFSWVSASEGASGAILVNDTTAPYRKQGPFTSTRACPGTAVAVARRPPSQREAKKAEVAP